MAFQPKTIFLFVSVSLLSFFSGKAQEDQLIALDVFSLLPHVQWAGEKTDFTFVVFTTKGDMVQSFTFTGKNHSKDGRSYRMAFADRVEEWETAPDIAFIPGNQPGLLKELKAKYGGLPLLIITEFDQAISLGSHLNLRDDGNIQINREELGRTGLSASSGMPSRLERRACNCEK